MVGILRQEMDLSQWCFNFIYNSCKNRCKWNNTGIKTIGNNTTGYSVRQTIDGYILAGGYDFSFANYFSYLFLVKLDANGNITSNFNIQ